MFETVAIYLNDLDVVCFFRSCAPKKFLLLLRSSALAENANHNSDSFYPLPDFERTLSRSSPLGEDAKNAGAQKRDSDPHDSKNEISKATIAPKSQAPL